MDNQKNWLVLNIFIIKKAAVIFNFCLFGNICNNFLVPRMIESACKTFMPIPTLDLDRVICSSIAKSGIGFWNYFFESWPLPLKETFVFSFQCYCIITERAIHFTKLQSFCHQTMPPAALRYKQCNDWKPVHAFVALQPPPY